MAGQCDEGFKPFRQIGRCQTPFPKYRHQFRLGWMANTSLPFHPGDARKSSTPAASSDIKLLAALNIRIKQGASAITYLGYPASPSITPVRLPSPTSISSTPSIMKSQSLTVLLPDADATSFHPAKRPRN